MCGICGFIHKERVNLDILKNMNRTIQYRGPDSEGYFLENYSENYQIGMAHQRLAIIDLSPLGNQPMFSDNEDIVVVFNGEIYNYDEIKVILEDKGYSFKSESDTEVIVKSYQEWGISCVKKFNGMFAIAIYDKKSRDFYLVRDRIGVKPLYYNIGENGIIFSSELKPLMLHPDFHKEINLHALSLYLFHGYITAPYSIFQNTYKLEPGSILKFNEGKISFQTYWSVIDQFNQKRTYNKTEEEWIRDLDYLITDSIKSRMVSDVPLGAFLSGGIDSSLVASIMQKVSDVPIKTFTIGFREEKYNEANFAKKIAKHLGTEHYELYLSENEAKEIVERIPEYYDEPFADSSQIATMFVSRLAKEHVTVSLSGDGGDELFCGYDYYGNILRWQGLVKYSKVANKIPLLKSCMCKLIRKIKYTKVLEMFSDNNIGNAAYISFITNYKIIKNYHPKFEPKYEHIMNITTNLQEKNMLKDIVTYLPDDIMTKVDRASMSVSLETRAPFVDDYRILEFSFDIPHSLKYKGGNSKYILKQLLNKYVPSELTDRPKMGFALPIYKWLRNDLQCLVTKYCNKNYIEEQAIFNWKEISCLLNTFFSKKDDDYVNRMVWHILVFQMWYEKYILEHAE